ncbi:leucyl/phenylalanyl-tRNA--protein transferase [Prochlorothrix hollandica]|uniref:Leucyl/phenylalanyl-tRNA--protein transferase n=1 Tax=Prochlorothrix hollandica PCC 9006 = CALU 1027 TaxID=317619 RepID=A0A0M2PT92_PROHO|nr:leucyl/phenylalanyl-tRNA--protein transferase [Prochlorothrix hollandica]KKI99324.1 leucyl/phenylalanyl-tRNA--protein transferase [Prochlorothrix hollandica PCC 9006 = CALU 1027]
MRFSITDIIQSYAQGYFLMAEDNGDLNWYSSRQRALIPLDHRFRYPKSLQRVLNQGRFRMTVNQDFRGVVQGCADREVTWISQELQEIYYQLHEAGWAYSFEAWQGDQLAGGILGLVLGGAFIGESMFFKIPDGSKVALVTLVNRLRSGGFLLFDAQMNNPHLERFGAYLIGDREYHTLLRKALQHHCVLKV